jgi:phosphoglycolate phosphatase
MLIVFDLDGTLIDSARDLVIATNQTRAHFGLPPLEAEVVQSYVGNGAEKLVQRALGCDASEELVSKALSYFVKFYRAHALQHTRLYPGVKELIAGLAASGHTLAVLTNKPVKISTDIVAGLGLGAHFRRIYGGDSFAQKKPDPIGITALMEETASRREDTWMVGDSGVDVQTARNANVRVCGVAWGFQPASFKAHPPDIIVLEPGELLKALEPVSLKHGKGARLRER